MTSTVAGATAQVRRTFSMWLQRSRGSCIPTWRSLSRIRITHDGRWRCATIPWQPGAVKQPTLVVYGSEDPWVPAQTSLERLRASSARHPNVEVAVIAGADHEWRLRSRRLTRLIPFSRRRKHRSPQRTLACSALGWLSRGSRASRKLCRDPPSDRAADEVLLAGGRRCEPGKSGSKERRALPPGMNLAGSVVTLHSVR